MADRDQSEEFYRLRQSALEQFQQRWPTIATFRSIGKQLGVRASFEREATLLRRGQPVKRKVVETFLEFLRKSKGEEWQNVTLDAIAVPDPYAAREWGPTNDWWDWTSIMSSIHEHFVDTRWGMYLADPAADCVDFARRCMRTVGYHHAEPGDAIDEADCVRRAERIMSRTRDEYAAWLLRLHEWHFRTTFHVTTQTHGLGGERFRQVGMASLLPVTGAAFDAIATGRMADMEIDESHLRNPSPYLFIHAIAEPDAGCPVPAVEVDKAQSRCIFYHMAYYTRGIKPFRPSVVTFGGTPKLEERLRRMGFRPTGSRLRTTDKPLMVLQAGEGRRDLDHLARYHFFRSILGLFRILNRDDWRDEDRR